uniref:EGF-like domain-containing protein n=1 Tax=Angiostrongylus costaricensis TaxID=334426 RepID=A0A158PIE0_ANGCS
LCAILQFDELTVPAVRVVRLQVDYPNASIPDVHGNHKWNSIMRNSVIASLRFVNKHWLICGNGPNAERLVSGNDCGKAQVTGEIVGDNYYRINVTFIAERDPIRNVKVEATSTVFAVCQIGLKGGIFQYTNALKALGKPSAMLSFDEAYFCYKGAVLADGDKCRLCASGSFFNTRSDTCEPCSRGYYQPQPGLNTCIRCPDELTTASKGAVNESYCIPVCPAGFFFDYASRICEPCSLRGYQPESGLDRCIPCPSSTVPLYLNSTRIEHCLEKCSPGWQRSLDGSRCEPCALGSFKSKEDSVCMLCPSGWTTLNKASKHLNDCSIKICYPGTFLNMSTLQCYPCDYGLYMDEYDGRICKLCPISTTTYQLGSNSITQCKSTNQCKSGAHGCHWLAACVDLPDDDHRPRYSCKCKPGYVGNGIQCTDACEGLCHNGATCLKTGRGEPHCVCEPGFTGRRCSSRI